MTSPGPSTARGEYYNTIEGVAILIPTGSSCYTWHIVTLRSAARAFSV